MNITMKKTVWFKRSGEHMEYKAVLDTQPGLLDTFTITATINKSIFYNKKLPFIDFADTINALYEDGYTISDANHG